MSDEWNPNLETEQEYSERMHRENDPHYFSDDDFGLHPDDYGHCGTNLYVDDYWMDGLCNQCAWHVAQGEGCDDAGCSGIM